MARLFVMSDNLAATVEIRRTDEGDCAVFCIGCSAGSDDGVDLVADTHERFNLEDAEQVAALHADRCKRCADPDCRTEGRHDAGHRCRKVA
jgi:hypothetical protein